MAGRLDRDQARSRLYEVLRADCDTEERIRRALEVGAEYFGVEHAFVTEVDPENNEWTVDVSTTPEEGAFHEGQDAAYATTYCRRTIENEDVLAVHDVHELGWEDSVAYKESGLQCYHGAPVMVDGEPVGTVCFSSETARADPFTDAEKAFTDLVAQMVGNELERERRREQLDEREAELEKRRELYRALIDASFEMVFRLDTDGVFTYLSPKTESLIGYTPDELAGRHYSGLVPDEETESLARDRLERVFGGKTIEEEYLPVRTADGGIVYFDVRLTPIYRAEVPTEQQTTGDIVAVQGVARDATNRKRRERLNRVLNRVLRHNLRNDMGIVRGYTEQLEETVSEENQEIVRRIRGAAERLVDLGETARSLEGNIENPPEFEPVDVVPIVTGIAEQMSERYPDARITVETPVEAIARAAPRLEAAMREVVDNAAEHGGPAVQIDIDVTVSAETVTVVVSDDGPGLPDQERAVLESGEETPLIHGSGLGLWLVRWIIVGLDGHVRVPQTDAGTRLELTLPRNEDDN